jgi:hypothetical protein
MQDRVADMTKESKVKPLCFICANSTVKKRVYCVKCQQWCHKSCANRKICCDDQQLMCDYVNDEENKNEILHVKIENLTRKVDSIKELLPHENSRTFCQNCVDPDKAQTKNKNLIANHLNLQSQVNNNITNKPAAINAKQQSSSNGSDSQRKQNFSSFIEIQKKNSRT